MPSEFPLPEPGTWAVDAAHSFVHFVGQQLKINRIRGRFAHFSGAVRLTEDIEHSQLEFTVDAASLVSDHEERDQKLKGPGYLDVERYPEIRFRSTAVRRTGLNRFEVHGDLTIKSVKRRVPFAVKYNGVVPAPWGGLGANFSARTRLDRRHFDMPIQSPTPVPGLLVVGNRVWLDLDISLAKR